MSGRCIGVGVCGAQAGALWGLVLYLMQWEAAGGFQAPEMVWFVLLRAPLGAERQEGDRGPAGGPSVGGER